MDNAIFVFLNSSACVVSMSARTKIPQYYHCVVLLIQAPMQNSIFRTFQFLSKLGDQGLSLPRFAIRFFLYRHRRFVPPSLFLGESCLMCMSMPRCLFKAVQVATRPTKTLFLQPGLFFFVPRFFPAIQCSEWCTATPPLRPLPPWLPLSAMRR